MKSATLALGVLAVAALAGMIGLALWQGMPLLVLFTDASAIGKLADFILLVALLGLAGMALFSKPSGSRTSLMAVLAWAAPFLGLAAAAFEAWIIWQGVIAVHVTHLAVVAPSVAEALLPLGLGLLAGAIAASLGARGNSVAA